MGGQALGSSSRANISTPGAASTQPTALLSTPLPRPFEDATSQILALLGAVHSQRRPFASDEAALVLLRSAGATDDVAVQQLAACTNERQLFAIFTSAGHLHAAHTAEQEQARASTLAGQAHARAASLAEYQQLHTAELDALDAASERVVRFGEV